MIEENAVDVVFKATGPDNQLDCVASPRNQDVGIKEVIWKEADSRRK